MASATLTLIGMYNWDNTLFNSLVLPDGIDKDLFVNTLLLKAGEFEVLYPDPDFMKQAIAVWGSKWYRTFDRWLEGTQQTWNPIHNYDRFEDLRDEERKKNSQTDNVKYDEDRTYDLTDERTPDLTETLTHDTTATTSQTVSGTTEHDISAYDQTGYTPSSKDTVNNGTNENTMTGDDTTTTTGTDTSTKTGTDKLHVEGKRQDISGSEQNTLMHTGHIYGNIGVTQAGDMLRNWYDISQWNLYDHMSDTFTNELLIPIY